MAGSSPERCQDGTDGRAVAPSWGSGVRRTLRQGADGTQEGRYRYHFALVIELRRIGMASKWRMQLGSKVKAFGVAPNTQATFGAEPCWICQNF